MEQMVLLVVDDDETFRNLVVGGLRSAGFQIHTAYNAVSALQVLKEHAVDLIVSDVRMPGGDGLSLLEKIREIDPKIPALMFITGFSEVSEQECIQRGAIAVLKKPFKKADLLAVVRKALLELPSRRSVV